ncbi:MAG: DUF3662 and FHA domain-containing protein [Eggerthellaceae bacterium]|nr:DUF3662 and FHA domain-containing protein [Eggerthellaceae bacterium]
MEDTVEGAASKMGNSPLSPVQIAKKAEKQMKREKMVGAGKQYAPTLYTVLVNPEDDKRLFGYYPTLAGETQTYLAAKAAEEGLIMDGEPLVRFIVDDELKKGKFEVIAEMVAAPLIEKLHQEEMERYGLAPQRPTPQQRNNILYGNAAQGQNQQYQPQRQQNAGQYRQPQGGYQQGYAQTPQQPAYDGYSDGDDESDEQLTAYLYDITNDRAFTLTGERMSIGRESASDIVIPDINVSRQHAEIRNEPNGTWVITDLGSTNGTYVNGRKIKSSPLRDADRLTMGTTSLEFQLI